MQRLLQKSTDAFINWLANSKPFLFDKKEIFWYNIIVPEGKGDEHSDAQTFATRSLHCI